MAATPTPRSTPAAGTTPLSPAARRGYGLGSVATGSFGTVPGLLLLPYLTDRLGIAAGLAGLIVFLPKDRRNLQWPLVALIALLGIAALAVRALTF